MKHADEIRNVIAQEMEALKILQDAVDDQYDRTVDLMAACRGKVIVTGVGKSGLIASKIASTLASTGTTSMFLHPTEALHGDLGMVAAGDIVLLLSKSGNSVEVNEMLTVLNKMGVTTIAVTGDLQSPMAKNCDGVLHIGSIAEACPHNLAPTSSTTAFLVLGDALAVTLMKLRGFRVEDFATYHPAGRLGRRLLLTVSDIMLKDDQNPVVEASASMGEFLKINTQKQAGAVSVVNGDGRIIGLITDYDLRVTLMTGRNILAMQLDEIMNRHFTSVKDDEKAFAALCLMKDRPKPITVLPVLNAHGRPVGMLRLQDLVAAGL